MGTYPHAADPAERLLEFADFARHTFRPASRPILREYFQLAGIPVSAEWAAYLSGAPSPLTAWLASLDDPPADLEPILAAAPLPRLHAIGFWHSTSEPHFPHPHANHPLPAADKRAVLKHLTAGTVWASWMGYSSCRICSLTGAPLGTSDLTDGIYLWPEGLPHYIATHDVALPPAFLDHILRERRKPSARELDLLRALYDSSVPVLDHALWLAWSGTPPLVSKPSRRGWTVTTPVHTRGPFTDDDIRRQIAAGDLQPYHRLWRLGIGAERKARELPAFARLFPKP